MKDAFFATIPPSGFGFSGGGLDRVSARRGDPDYVAGLRARADARFALIAREMPILGRADAQAFWPAELAERFAPACEILLGVESDGAPVFAALLPDDAVEQRSDQSDGFLDRRELFIPGRDDLALTDMRSIAMQGLVDPQTVAILGAAKAMTHWHARHRFCANCGQPSQLAVAGWRRDCPSCHTQHFPRTDPVVIMLAVDGDRCLLGRQARFPKNMYSALAGFLEPGETVEEAVRREIREEAGIVCDEVRYLASQPWPFPASLMIGCIARAATFDIAPDDEELEDARWFARDEVRAMYEKRHPGGLIFPVRMAIAHHLVKFWLES
jgi:NAD+ diphosphatase